MIGELDYGSQFHPDDDAEKPAMPVLAYLVYLCFLVVVTTVIMNLVVSGYSTHWNRNIVILVKFSSLAAMVTLLVICAGNSLWIPHTKASDAELWCFLWSAPE